MTESLEQSAVPVFQVDGALQGQLAGALRRLEVEETTAGLKTLSARVVGHGYRQGSDSETQLFLDGAILNFGSRLQVAIGPAEDKRTIFDGYISSLQTSFQEGLPPEVVFFAEDKLMQLRMTHRSKTYNEVTDSDIVRAIASQHGIQAQADAEGPTYDVVQQWNMSDLAFLRERARLIQAEFWFADDKLWFQTRNQRTGTSLTLGRENQLISVEARADLAHQRTKVTFSGFDAKSRDKINEDAEASVIQAEISGGNTGPSLLQQFFGDVVSFRVRETPLLNGEARAWAKAEMLRRARAFVTVTGVTRGSPDMVVGSRLTFPDIGHPFEGSGYYVTRVQHTYDLTQGHRTRFASERATLQEGA
jgi:uncharacterized protein